MREITARDFQAYGRPIEWITYFKYLGHIITDSGDYWPAIVGNLGKASKIWERLSITWEGGGGGSKGAGDVFQVSGAGGDYFWG